MAARILNFLRRTVTRDWSPQDLAEFYRVEAALLQAGLRVSSERGVTDEGDPWFVFCRADDDEVIIHFARIDGRYLVSMPGYDETVTGTDFQTLVRALVERHPVLRPPQRLSKVVLHPAALLLLLVASALLKPGHAQAADNAVAAPPGGAAHSADRPGSADRSAHDIHQETAILAAIGYVVAPASVSLAEWALPHSAATHDGMGFTHATAPPPPGPDPVAPRSGSFTPDHVTAPAVAPIVVEHHGSPPVAGPSPLLDLPSSGFVPATHATETVHALVDPMPAHPVPMPVTDLPTVMDAAAALPHSTALSVFLSLPGTETISFSATLPPDLSSALHDSVHMKAYQPAASAPAALSSAPAGGTASQNATVSPVDTGAHTSASTAASQSGVTSYSHADAGASGALPAASTTAVSAASTSGPASSTPVISVNGVLADLKAFDTTVAHPVSVFASNQVVVFDAAVVGHMTTVAQTFDFPDGSSISLVGLPAELAHLPVHA